jgi:hypothetical protein
VIVAELAELGAVGTRASVQRREFSQISCAAGAWEVDRQDHIVSEAWD